jgi:hypothetical protein
MAEIISIETCAKLLTRYNDTDKAADFKLIRYYLTDNELVILILYRDVNLRCVIDKLSFVDNEVPNATSIQRFIDFYLKPPMPVIEIVGEEKDKENKFNITVSQT